MGSYSDVVWRPGSPDRYYSAFLAIRAAICVAVGQHIDDKVGHGDLKDALYAAGNDTGSSDLTPGLPWCLPVPAHQWLPMRSLNAKAAL